MQTIMEWVEESFGSGVIHEAWHEFSLWDEEAPPLDLATPHRQMFRPWVLFAWHPSVLAATDIRDPAFAAQSGSDRALSVRCCTV